MESERDVWNTTYFHSAIRKRIGETLLAGYDLSQPLPDRMRALLVQLEKPSAEREADRRHPLPPNSSQSGAQMPTVQSRDGHIVKF